MFKKVLLALSLTAFMSWAQDDFDDEGFVSAPAAASSEQEDDDDGFPDYDESLKYNTTVIKGDTNISFMNTDL